METACTCFSSLMPATKCSFGGWAGVLRGPGRRPKRSLCLLGKLQLINHHIIVCCLLCGCDFWFVAVFSCVNTISCFANLMSSLLLCFVICCWVLLVAITFCEAAVCFLLLIVLSNSLLCCPLCWWSAPFAIMICKGQDTWCLVQVVPNVFGGCNPVVPPYEVLAEHTAISNGTA